MAHEVIETVTFRLMQDITREQFVEAADRANGFITAQPGFVRRRLSRADDGTWIEHIEWTDMDSAKAAAAAIGNSEDARPFVDAIDGTSIAMSHSSLEIAVN